jgi:hypothetical protein
MIFLLYLLSSLLIVSGLFVVLPSPHNERVRQIRVTFGFEQVKAQAQAAGMKLEVKHYLLLLALSMSVGVVIALLTHNWIFIGFGVGISIIVPKIWISHVKYKKRREILMNLPGNLRLLTSKLRVCKSMLKSLEASLPLMNGVTTASFERLYQSLQIGIDLQTAIKKIKQEIHFKQLDDYCEKVLMGEKDGYHNRVIQSMRETIDDIYADTQLLKEMDIKNRKKQGEVYWLFTLFFGFVYLFRYMELQLAEQLGSSLTLDTLFGQLLIVSMATTALIGLWKKDTYLRLNLDDL